MTNPKWKQAGSFTPRVGDRVHLMDRESHQLLMTGVYGYDEDEKMPFVEATRHKRKVFLDPTTKARVLIAPALK